MTEADVARIPPGNLRVPRAEFAAVWATAERLSAEEDASDDGDWYPTAVVITCRWLATSVVQTRNGRGLPAHAPVSKRSTSAYEELIEAEYLAAELLDMREPELLHLRPGWVEGVRATLRWAWRREGPPPLPVPSVAAP